MLERYSLSTPKEELTSLIQDVEITDRYQPRYNAAPSQLLPIITNENQGGFSFFYWGTAPKWSRNKCISQKLINANKEELELKPTYKKSLSNNRCLIPADGFYGWKIVGKKSKIPHRVILNEGTPFFMAGLWEEYQDEADETIHTFSIITVPSNDLVAPISNSMPAIFTLEQGRDWLNPHNSLDGLLDMLTTYPSEKNGYVHSITND